METGTSTKSVPPGTLQNWYEEFGVRPRFPFTPFEEIKKLVGEIKEPQVFLRPAGNDKTDITVRLPAPSSVVPREMRKRFSRHDITLSRAFENTLWKKLEAEKSTIWAEVTTLVPKLYREAWLQWFRLQYLGHSHPKAEREFKKLEQQIESEIKVTRRGRRPAIQAELDSLRKRYHQLLPKCRLLYRAASRAARSVKKNNREAERKEIRFAIWQSVRGSIHGMPGDGYIFGGDAFKSIRHRKRYRMSTLHDPDTWKPHQLAIALLSLERSQAYQTIEKKIVPTKQTSKRRV